MYAKNKIILVSLLLISVVCTLLAYCIDKRGLLRDVLLGVTASATVIFLYEIVTMVHDFTKFSYLRGRYRRAKILNGLDERDPATSTRYGDMTESYGDVNSEVHMSYKGNGNYTGKLEYEEGHVEFRLALHKDNRLTGEGVYFYCIGLLALMELPSR